MHPTPNLYDWLRIPFSSLVVNVKHRYIFNVNVNNLIYLYLKAKKAPQKTYTYIIHTHIYIYIYIYIYIFSSCYSKHVWLIFFCEKQKKIFFKDFIGKCFNKTTLDPICCQMKIHFTNEDYFCFQLNYPFKKARNHIVRFVSCTETKTWLPRNKKDITAKHSYNCHVCGPWLDLCLEKLACACSAYRTIISWGWLCCYHKSFSARLFCF